ncbi:MAG: hypothetical protein PUE15_00070 [Prevotella sp.]|nr:hypothetical protein [Prevotella sp.]
MEYSNSQILAAVVSEWARPAISQIAAGNLMRLPVLQSLQSTISSLGIVSGSYALQKDIEPLIQPIVNSLITPMLARYFGQIPEESIPQMAHDIVEKMRGNGPVSVLEGMVTFDEEDITELSDLLDKNLPVGQTPGYQVKH